MPGGSHSPELWILGHDSGPDNKKHPKLIKMEQPEEPKGGGGGGGGETVKFPEVGMLCSRTTEI